MNLKDGLAISSLIEDPVKQNLSNINKTKAYFFHGTRKELLPLIKNDGFQVKPNRPIFTLDPIYSMGYCRKSESYLRGLISSDNKVKLQEEVNELIARKVITKDDLKDKKYMWWINKANKYYESQFDITKEGILLVFPWSINDLEEAPESKIVFRKKERKAFLEGAPSYWRTRQYFYKTKRGFYQKSFIEVNLNQQFVKQTKELYSSTSKGELNKNYWEKTVKSIKIDFQKASKLDKDSFKLSFLSQVVESILLKELRDLLIGVLKNSGIKVYWKRNNKYLEDPRWKLEKSEIDKKIEKLQKNDYPFESWGEFVNKKLSVVCDLK